MSTSAEQTPLVSVIIPLYNAQEYVLQTLATVLEQHHTRLEVIVVNDGSKDGSLALVESYAQQFTASKSAEQGPWLRIIDQANMGPPGARNTGIQAAQGQYIAFVDADDLWHPEKISRQLAFLESHPDYVACFCDWHVWPADSDGRYRQPADFMQALPRELPQPEYDGWLYETLLLDCVLLTSTVMLRSSTARSLGGFDLRWWNGDDYDYWLRLSRQGKIRKLPFDGVLYRMLEGSVSKTPKATNYELEVLKEALYHWGPGGLPSPEQAGSPLALRLQKLHLSFAWIHYRKGDQQLARRLYRQLWREQPLNLSYLAYALGLVPR